MALHDVCVEIANQEPLTYDTEFTQIDDFIAVSLSVGDFRYAV